MDSRNANYELVGVSQNIRRIRELIGQVAETGFNVIVCGETGVGKELVVSNLYQRSNRLGQPFIKVNCAALPDTLLESEMFGYERGAFTGAIRTRRGKFEQANGGVLFLDEIGDMSLPLQSKLLHVLQGGDFTPLGSEKPLQTDVWVIAATHRDLERDVERGHFRDDLYYRLSTIRISVAPLRNRPEDVPLLIDYYIKKYAQQFNGTHVVGAEPGGPRQDGGLSLARKRAGASECPAANHRARRERGGPRRDADGRGHKPCRHPRPRSRRRGRQA